MYETTDGAVIHRIRLHDPDTVEIDTSEGFRTLPVSGRILGGVAVVRLEEMPLTYEWMEPRR
jgi:hypothetical protein